MEFKSSRIQDLNSENHLKLKSSVLGVTEIPLGVCFGLHEFWDCFQHYAQHFIENETIAIHTNERNEKDDEINCFSLIFTTNAYWVCVGRGDFV